jgi:DNA segregation ATPase FtsK/SpoIIIE, S-DNA-T family
MPRPLIRSSRSRAASRAALLPESMRDFLTRTLRTVLGGFVMLLAIAVALALVSYNSRDPSWNTDTSLHGVHNLLGKIGSYGADILWQSFGLGSFALAVICAAWGWRILSDSKLDMVPGRVIASLIAMLALATGLATLAVNLPPDMPALGGAFGKILAAAAVSLVPLSWGRYLVAPLMLMLAVTALYMAAALSLGEWHFMAKLLHRTVWWAMRQGHFVARSFWRILRNDKTGVLDDEEEEETEAEQETETEAEEESEDNQFEIVDKPEVKRVKTKAPLIKRPAASARQARLALRAEGEYPLPPLDLLQWPNEGKQSMIAISEEALEKNAKLLESVLADFGVNGAITKVSPGPVVTLYELEPSPGTRAARVISLADDIARNMSVTSVRVATVPGRNVIGIELPNARRETVYLRELLQSDAYNESRATLPLVLGKDIAGAAVIADLARMPHLLIAGTTGSGKSVAINTMILSLLYRMPPQKCRFIMIDPKMLELSVYEGIPHLLAPVVTEPKKAIMALRWTVREMEERYRAMSKLGVRNIDGYNMRLREAAKEGESLMRTVQTGFDRETGKPIYEEQPLDLTELPFIVVIVDEMADLMIVAGKEIEGAIQRLAQMARAAGIHIMMATQRPSVDVITGTIKANFPTRISFQVTSKIDSRTILGEQGAEQLLGQGDMLYMQGGGRVTRVHGPFVRDDEVENIVKFLKKQGEPEYLDEVTEDDGRGDIGGDKDGGFGFGGNGNSGDELYDKAVDIVLRERKASTSFIQRQLQLGYNKAANLVERMEREGIIGPANAMGKREVFGRKPDE